MAIGALLILSDGRRRADGRCTRPQQRSWCTSKFDFGNSGSIFIDGTSSPNTVGKGDGKTVDCTIGLIPETFMQIAEGKPAEVSAFMEGKLRVRGDIGLAIKLGRVLKKARG